MCFFSLFFCFLQIERDTLGKLQCHPYPHEYSDPQKQCSHGAFFMGLQRKQGEVILEGQQFDIRGTVDEFRHSVNMYVFWRPGMEIYISHVRRKQIPLYVFPDGHNHGRLPKLISQHPSEKLSRKRKADETCVEQDECLKRQSLSPQNRNSVSPVIVNHSCEIQESNLENVGGNRQMFEVVEVLVLVLFLIYFILLC